MAHAHFPTRSRTHQGRNATVAGVLLALLLLAGGPGAAEAVVDSQPASDGRSGYSAAVCARAGSQSVSARNTQLSPHPSVTLQNRLTDCTAQVTLVVWRITKTGGAGVSQAVSLRQLFETGQGEYAQAISAAAFEDATFELSLSRLVDVAPGASVSVNLAYSAPCANHVVAAYLGNGVTKDLLEAGVVGPERGCRATAQVPLQTAAELSTRVVAAYFFYWYDLPRGIHAEELTDRPADSTSSYRSVDWFKQQFSDMAAAGIDLALATYWGSAEVSSDVGTVNMGRAAAQLALEGKPAPKVAMFLDTGSVARWPFEQRDLTKAENRARLYSMVKRFYEALPREQWGQVDGKTVLWLWSAWFDIRFDGRVFDDLRAWFARDFDSDLYIVGESSWRLGRTPAGEPVAMALDMYYDWGASLHGYHEAGGGVAQVGPGYDERELGGPGRERRFALRDGGAFYERGLSGAVASTSRFLAIETWNEFHEASDIAESVEYGRRYIEITRQYADAFKRG